MHSFKEKEQKGHTCVVSSSYMLMTFKLYSILDSCNMAFTSLSQW
jgi:hypothetical protein